MTEAALEHPGATLKEARRSLGASVADIAKALHLADEVVVALEEGQYERLPPRTYVVGYVRAYARQVGLNEEVLCKRMEAAMPKGAPSRHPSQVVVLVPPKPTLAERAQRHFGTLIFLVVVLVVLATASALWWASGYYDWSFPAFGFDERGVIGQRPVATTEIASSPTTTTNVDTVALTWPLRVAPSPPSPTAVIDSPEEPPSPVDAATDAPADNGESFVDEAITAAMPTPSNSMPSVRAADTLGFRFNEDSWVEVRNGVGDLIHADLGEMGQTISVRGDAPFSILVGYAAGVQLTYNGDPVALTPHTRQSVARLVVGH